MVAITGIWSRHTSAVSRDRQDFLHTRVLRQSNGRLRNPFIRICACQMSDDRSVHT